MEKRIILTGSNGLLGQKIVPLLASLPNVSLLATSRGPDRHPLQSGYTYTDIDLTDHTAWETLFKDFQPTDVINSAAITQVDLCETEKEICDAVNVHAVSNLVKRCQEHRSRLLHISTDFVFDGQNGPYRETDQPNPVNYYGHSKWQAEQLILKSGISHVILRTMLLYGVSVGMSRSNIVLWAKKSLEEGKDIRVVDDQLRCPTLVEDLALATVTAAMRQVEGIYHISGAEPMPIIDIAYAVADYWKLDRNLISKIDSPSLNQAARRPPITGFIIDKARKDLDYQPHSLQEGFALVNQQLQEIKP
ncbi:MAG: NAD(P)-dependent oxidoreductase [Bacteroidota bacterium]